jgi:hypothetical protein
MSNLRWMLIFTCIAPLCAWAQTVQPLPPTTRLVALSGAPAATEETFTIAAAQDLTITLTDLQTPSSLSSATMVVTQGGAIVQIAAGNAAATLAPPATTATLTLPAAVGQYTLRVFGAPNISASVGFFTVCVAPSANPSACIADASLVGNISTPSSASDPTLSTISQNFTVLTGGTYTVNFADDQFPVALNMAPNLALFQGSVPVSLGIASGATVNLSPGTYTLLAIAQADQTIKAGLYGIRILGPAGVAPALDNTYPVGLLSAAPQINNPSAQNLNLSVEDFGFPIPLITALSLVTSGGTVLGSASSSTGPQTLIAAPAGILQVWTYATSGSDSGTYEVDLNSSSGNLLTLAFGVAGGASQSYAFVTNALSAGNYTLAVGDFGVPAALQSLTFALAQGGAILQKSASSATSGSIAFTAGAGPVVILADAVVQSAGNGLFGVGVLSSNATTPVFQITQGVTTSDLFDSQIVNLGVSADFDVTLGDLKFPGQFQDLALVVSQGGTVLGKAFGGGTFTIAATPGPYELTFIATPAAQQQYGLYAIAMTYTAPTVTLSASASSVTAGATSTLSWTTKDATSCTASGGTFTGDQPVGSGSLAVSVTATTTYTLTCVGPGGSTAQSVTVTATAAAKSSGGGGRFDPTWLLSLWLLVLAVRFSPRAARARVAS